MPISLVTGGAGFIGSHLVEALLARGGQVRVLDDLSCGTLANLPVGNPRLEIVHGDTGDPVLLARITEGVDYVFHLAIPSHEACAATLSVERWAGTTDTLNILVAAHQCQVKRVVYASCESVYGPAMARALTETDPTLPLSPYALAKLTGEQQCVAFSAIYGLETVRLRYSNVFGPRQLRSGARPPAIIQVLKAMLLGQCPSIEGDGQEPQDFIYVGDVAHANLLAAEARRVGGKVYNIARGRPTTLNDVVATINRLLGTDLKPRYVRSRTLGHGPRLTEIARAEADLGFCPGTDLEQGLLQCIAYYRAHPERLQVSHVENHLNAPHFVATETLNASADTIEACTSAGGSRARVPTGTAGVAAAPKAPAAAVPAKGVPDQSAAADQDGSDAT